MDICQSSSCDNSPVAICLHCQQHLCVSHLLGHNEELICKANIYCDEFNQLTEQIENLSFNEPFLSAEDDLNDWINDQMKQLDKIYDEKLYQLKQSHIEVNEKVKNFKQSQQAKIFDIHRRLFNSQLNKQVNVGQLNQMKTAVEQLRKDFNEFKTNQCSITIVNNDQINYSYKPNIDIQFKDNQGEYDNTKKSQLRADAKPFEYVQNYNSISSIRQNDITGRIYDECHLVESMNKTTF